MDLPREIWQQIVQYIPKDEVFNLISLNRSVLNIVLDERYKEVLWVSMLDKTKIRALTRLRYVLCGLCWRCPLILP